MKTTANIKSAGTRSCCLLIALCVLSPAISSAADKAAKRRALVYMSDGTQYEGIVQLTPGIDFRMTKMPGDKTTTTVDLETIRAKSRVFTFNFNVVKEMTFSPKSEEYLKKFKIINMISPLGAGEGKKVRFGAPYPVLKPKCTVVFNSGETVVGVVDTRVAYLKIIEPDTGFVTGTKKFVMRSKYSGKPGQSLDDLVHVKRIKMLDEGDQFARSMPIELRSFDFDSISTNQVKITKWGDSDLISDGVYTLEEVEKVNKRVLSEGGKPAEYVPYLIGMRGLTMDTLSKVVVKRARNGTISVHSTLGENVFLAAEINGKWVAGWPAEGTKRTELFKSVETEALKVHDYYTEKKMLGIISEDRDRKITVLMRLRRDIPNPEFALKWAQSTTGGFEMGPDGKLMEFYRLSIWRFVRDNKTGKMALVDRGTFCRTRIDEEEDTPEMGIAPELWPVVMKDGKLIVGGK
jgi:hypothetical protein|tara:strand:- start:912 stop:2297 length:1386 start_codon:yes stop_codon:yes gene_type:complete